MLSRWCGRLVDKRAVLLTGRAVVHLHHGQHWASEVLLTHMILLPKQCFSNWKSKKYFPSERGPCITQFEQFWQNEYKLCRVFFGAGLGCTDVRSFSKFSELNGNPEQATAAMEGIWVLSSWLLSF